MCSSDLALLAKESYSEKYGARNLRRYLQTAVEDRIANLIIEAYAYRPVEVVLSVENGALQVELIKEER